MKKKEILEYMNEITQISPELANEDPDLVKKLGGKGNVIVTNKPIGEGKDDHKGQSCKEAHPKMSHKAWKKKMEESDTLDLNLLEKRNI